MFDHVTPLRKLINTKPFSISLRISVSLFYLSSHRAFAFKTLPTFTHIAGSVLYSLKRLESQALPQYRRWLFTLSQPFEDSNPIRSDEAPLKRILRILTKKKKYFIFLKLYLIICIYAYLYTYMSRRLLIASDRTIIGLLLATIHLIKAHILLRLSFVSKNLVYTLRSVLRGHARTIEWKAVTHPTSLKL